MHDPTKEGNEFFLCDFCARHWEPTRPMVEGHQGSLICGECLTGAFAAVGRTADAGRGEWGPEVVIGAKCTMCLETREEPLWQSPARAVAHICRRCARQSATMMERDESTGWKRPE